MEIQKCSSENSLNTGEILKSLNMERELQYF